MRVLNDYALGLGLYKSTHSPTHSRMTELKSDLGTIRNDRVKTPPLILYCRPGPTYRTSLRNTGECLKFEKRGRHPYKLNVRFSCVRRIYCFYLKCCLLLKPFNFIPFQTFYRKHMQTQTARKTCHWLTERKQICAQPSARGVHVNGEDWNPMGPMGFPWEWE